jgi:hypothetical protein
MTKTGLIRAIHRIHRIHPQPAATEQSRLAAELSDYRSDADRNDLNALLDDYPARDADRIRDLLNRHPA